MKKLSRIVSLTRKSVDNSKTELLVDKLFEFEVTKKNIWTTNSWYEARHKMHNIFSAKEKRKKERKPLSFYQKMWVQLSQKTP